LLIGAQLSHKSKLTQLVALGYSLFSQRGSSSKLAPASAGALLFVQPVSQLAPFLFILWPAQQARQLGDIGRNPDASIDC